MKKAESYCPNCFKDIGQAAVCPHCGYQETNQRSPIILPPGTLLDRQFLVGRVLGKPGGFGITYLGFDTRLEMRVAIKEYLPRDLAGRDTDRRTIAPHSLEDRTLFRYGLEKFLQEARTLARFDHPNVVRVRNYFEANATGYLVMDYYEGMTLAAYLAQRGAPLPEEQAVAIMMPVLDGLRVVHAKGVLHRDIDPNNIYLAKTEGGNVRPILLDFGAARVAMGERSKSLSVILKPGYAPYEQYRSKGNQGPWTDVYACAATLYRMVTGEVPLESVERVMNDTLTSPKSIAPTLSGSIEAAIMTGLAVRTEDRPQTVAALQALLMPENAPRPLAEDKPAIKPSSAPGPVPEPSPTPPVRQYARVGGWLLFFCISLTILNPLFTLVNLGAIGEAMDYFDEDSSEFAFLSFDMLAALALMGYSIFAGVNLWRIKPGAVRKAQTYLKVFIGYSVLEWILTGSIFGYFGPEIIQGGIYFGIWYSYLAKSKRVAGTFGDAR